MRNSVEANKIPDASPFATSVKTANVEGNTSHRLTEH